MPTDFDKRAVPQLVIELNAISNAGRLINLAKRQLGELSPESIVKVFEAIFRGLIDLDISSNKLGLRTKSELIAAFRALPASLIKLNLSDNKFYIRGGDELGEILKVFSKTLKILDLSRNKLGLMSGGELAKTLAKLSTGITTLHLNDNSLGTLNSFQLAKALKAIPQHVTTLNLSNNNLGDPNRNDVPQSSDDDSDDEREWSNDGELELEFAAIPPGVTELDISNNKLGIYDREKLIKAIATLPKSVTKLNLADNSFGLWSPKELTRLLTAIPNGITQLELGDNGLCDELRAELLTSFSVTHVPVASVDVSTVLSHDWIDSYKIKPAYEEIKLMLRPLLVNALLFEMCDIIDLIMLYAMKSSYKVHPVDVPRMVVSINPNTELVLTPKPEALISKAKTKGAVSPQSDEFSLVVSRSTFSFWNTPMPGTDTRENSIVISSCNL